MFQAAELKDKKNTDCMVLDISSQAKEQIFHLKMKTIILFGLLGATISAPIIPQRLLSASNSNEFLLNLNNAPLQPLQLQVPFNSWIPPFSGILQQQQQVQTPGLSPASVSTLDWVARLFPNQITFPGQVSVGQGNQLGQLDPSQPQTPVQTQQGPNQEIPYVFFKMPQEQTQMPFYTQFGYIPQQVEPVIPGGQQKLAFDTFMGTAPETAAMPAGGVTPYLSKKMINFRHASGGMFIPSTSQKPSTTNVFAPAIDPTITPELMEDKAKTGSLKEP
uniref:Odontogenic ameloblast-associated protein n=1 Tax=Molossus molossus TaxID=27622 RepID=A0A7J8JY85_MOLMO|nr:odontogenic, ameloblast associated [Molossus molossus]